MVATTLYLQSPPGAAQSVLQDISSDWRSQTPLDWEKAGTSTVWTSLIITHLLEQVCTFREKEEVISFLEKHLFLAPLLLEACLKIGQYFPGSRVSLQVFVDPEGEEADKLLAAIAITGMDADETIDRLHQFNRGGWIHILRRAQGKLGITLEFP